MQACLPVASTVEQARYIVNMPSCTMNVAAYIIFKVAGGKKLSTNKHCYVILITKDCIPSSIWLMHQICAPQILLNCTKMITILYACNFGTVAETSTYAVKLRKNNQKRVNNYYSRFQDIGNDWHL